MEERRRETRKKLMAFTPVYRAEKGRLLGYLEDLTRQGAKVIGAMPLKSQTEVTLFIELPGRLPGVAATALTIPARVTRCEPDDGPQNFVLGFEFIEMNPGNSQIIQALLERYHFKHQIK
jgi:hypothetical protein